MSQENREVAHPYFKLKDSHTESMWDDFQFGFDKSKYAEYYNDYFTFAPADFTITTTEDGGGDATELITDAVGGVLLITNDAGGSDLDNLQMVGESVLPAAGKQIWFESRFFASDVSSSTVIIGLSITDASLVAGISNDAIFFSVTGDSTLAFTSRASSVSSTAASLKTVTDSGMTKVGFKISGTNKIEYWVDDVKKGSFVADIPVTELRLSYAITNGTTANEAMGIDYVRIVQER